MSDPIAEDLISAYVDDELDATARVEVEAALADSPALADVKVEVEEARDAVRSLPMVDLPPGVLDAIMAGVAAADPVTSGAAESVVEAAPVQTAAEPVDELKARRRRRVRMQRWLAGSAAAVVLMFVLVASPRAGRVTPAVGRLVDNHAARASDDSDPTSLLASLSVATPMALFR
jgi:anti-sigma factor RsiW